MLLDIYIYIYAMSTTHYYFDHISWDPTSKQWFVHLQIPMNLVFTESLMIDSRSVSQDLCLLLESAKDQDPNDFKGTEYGVVTRRHQIDKNGRLFVAQAWNIRQQPCASGGMTPSSHVGTPLAGGGVRWATQYDFDKFCFDNPDTRYPYDWNAEVYKAFISPVRVRTKK